MKCERNIITASCFILGFISTSFTRNAWQCPVDTLQLTWALWSLSWHYLLHAVFIWHRENTLNWKLKSSRSKTVTFYRKTHTGALEKGKNLDVFCVDTTRGPKWKEKDESSQTDSVQPSLPVKAFSNGSEAFLGMKHTGFLLWNTNSKRNNPSRNHLIIGFQISDLNHDVMNTYSGMMSWLII